MESFISRLAAVGFFFLYLSIIETSSNIYEERRTSSLRMDTDFITVEIGQTSRHRRAARRGCLFKYKGEKLTIPINQNYTTDKIPCITWFCYRSGRLGLLRLKSGCLFEDRCILWNPYHESVEKTGKPCDERMCRIHWRKGVLQYGMVAPLKDSHCDYNGTCYIYGDVIDFPENCTTAICKVEPIGNRWIRRPLWWPTSSGCSLNGQCYANGTLFTYGQCLEYTCNASVNVTQAKKDKYIEFKFESVSNLLPVLQGCLRHTGGCLKVNETYQASECITVKCVEKGHGFQLTVTDEGCLHKNTCVKVNTTKNDRCVSKTCKKRNVDNTLDYYFDKKKEVGCPNYFNPEDEKCYKKGETMTSTESYGQSKGCSGSVNWKCDPKSKSVYPNCPGGT